MNRMLKLISRKNILAKEAPFEQLVFSIISVLYFSTILLWQLPDSAFKDTVLGPIRPVVYFWGLEQSWRFFTSPMYRENRHAIAIANYEDGIGLALEPGMATNVSVWKRVSEERQLAFFNYELADEGWKDWRVGGIKALLKDYSSPTNPLRSVSFNEFTSEIPKPETSSYTRENPKPQSEFKHLFHIALDFGNMP